jgi:hypothetical protein
MPAPLNINREAVKTLAIAIGVRQAAREMGLPESSVKSWSTRGKWFADTPKPPHLARVASNASTPSDALATRLANDERETRASLSQYARKVSERASRRSHLDDAPLVHKVAQTAGIVHRWSEGMAANQFTLNVLNVGSLDVSVGE